ncbi:MAG: hypothetical protein GY868_15705 [Deltaproteobacteria bacterium]|nr:hypothetical protein [Deltaproteobacteria bacterium]
MQNDTSRNQDYLYIHDLHHGNYMLNIPFGDAMTPMAVRMRRYRHGILHTAVKPPYLHGLQSAGHGMVCNYCLSSLYAYQQGLERRCRHGMLHIRITLSRHYGLLRKHGRYCRYCFSSPDEHP